MSKQIEFDSRQTLFIIKTVACFLGLPLVFSILMPRAFMQSDDVQVTTTTMSNTMQMNGNYKIMGNYKPTPEPPKSTVRGRVIYGDTGRAVRRAGLMLMSAKGAGGGGSRESSGVTNERGEFEIKGVVAGSYFVSVSTPGILTPFSSLVDIDSIRLNDAAATAEISKNFQEVAVNGINDADVTIVVKRGAAITGRIMYADGEEAAGVRVEVLRRKNGQYNAVVTSIGDILGAMFGGGAGGLRTDDRGVFRIAGLPAGEYVVRVVENVSHTEKSNSRGGDDEFFAMLGFSPSSMVATYYPNASDPKKAEVIKVALGQEQAEINITIPDRALHDLNGVAVNKATRAPLKNVELTLKGETDVNSIFGAREGDIGKRVNTDEQGRWSYKQLPAGKYTLVAKSLDSESDGGAANAQKAKQPKFAQAQKEIVVEEKDAADLITVELGYGASVSGTIAFDNGEAFAQPIFVSASDENGKFSESDFIGSPYYDDGNKPAPKKTQEFKIEGVAAGRVFVNAAAGGDKDAGQKFYVKNILLGGRDISRAAIETKEGEEIKGVQIILSRDVGTIKGTVLKVDKSPAAGAKILFVSTDKARRQNSNSSLFALANNDGEFETFGAPGEYFAVIYTEEDFSRAEKMDVTSAEWLESKIADAQKVTIKAKETEKITLTMPENR